jgi:hypothetical protein
LRRFEAIPSAMEGVVPANVRAKRSKMLL